LSDLKRLLYLDDSTGVK